MALTDEDVREILRIIDESRARRAADRDAGLQAARAAGRGRAASGHGAGTRDEPGPATEPGPASEPTANGAATIDAPMLGTFYRASAPGEHPFVEVGAPVEPDTVVCLIEVMKMMNSITAGVAGTVVEVVRGERGARRVRRSRCSGSNAHDPRVFVANRGEIAVRIVRACRALGLEAVVGVSDVDRDSAGRAARRPRRLHRPGARRRDSYLRPETIVQAALGTGCDAIHPGYGFLSENPRLAALAREDGIAFVGPAAPRSSSSPATSSARAPRRPRPGCRSCPAARSRTPTPRTRSPPTRATRCC